MKPGTKHSGCRFAFSLTIVSCIVFSGALAGYESRATEIAMPLQVNVSANGLVSVRSFGAPLSSVAQEIERKTGIEVRFSSQQAANTPVTLSIDALDVTNAMHAILRGTSYMSSGGVEGKSRWTVMSSLDSPAVSALATLPTRQDASGTTATLALNGNTLTGRSAQLVQEVRNSNSVDRAAPPVTTSMRLNAKISLDHFGALPVAPGSEYDSSNPMTQNVLDAYAKARDSALAIRAERTLVSADASVDLQKLALREIVGNASNEATAVWSGVVTRLSSINDSNISEGVAMAVWQHAANTGFSAESEALLRTMLNSPQPTVQRVSQRAINDMLQYRNVTAVQRR